MSNLKNTKTEASSPVSEKTALNEILNWSLSRAPWQRDALRRIITTGEKLVGTDIEELYQICVDDKSLFSPLSKKYIFSGSASGPSVSLMKIENPCGINALASDQALNFSVHGLTVVYGDNGSGKSGYVRVLKHACRSRDSKLAILCDINDPEDTSQSADIHYAIGTDFEHMSWSPSSPTNTSLPLVSIFDSKSANTHLANQHHVAYTPFPMFVLSELSDVCDLLKTKIGNEVSKLQLQTPSAIKSPNLNAQTAAGAFLAKISTTTKLSELDFLTSISDADKQRVASLQSDLAGDPKKVVAGLSSLKNRLQTHAKLISELIEATSDAEFLKLVALRKEVEEKSELALVAADKLFKTSALPEIGGHLWKALWEAARVYSDNEAYNKQKFPKVNSLSDLCVLCLQPVEDDAAKRWSNFEEFIKGTTKIDESKARSELAAFTGELLRKKVKISIVSDLKKIIGDELGYDELAKTIQRVSLTAIKRFNNLTSHSNAFVDQTSLPAEKLATVISQIDSRILEIQKSENEDVRDSFLFEISSHRDRLSLQGLKMDVVAEVERLKKISQIKKAAKTTAKISITNKNKELSNKLVTNVLRARFAREISKFELLATPVELKKQADRNAQSYFKVVLVGKPDEPIGEILSEGEHRCVALAAFLAELVTSREYSGIVFDDPMSSLDHIYRQKVARRLAEESEHRQVIIFTHDISFLFEITREAEKQIRPVAYQTIRRNSKGPGIVESDLPFKAKMAGSMENSIRSELKALKGGFDVKTQIQREILAGGIITHIRKAWEQGIADFIEPVIARFNDNIKVNSLFKLLVLQEQDVLDAQAARSRLSVGVHATSETLNPAEVTHSDLVNELNILREWLGRLRENQKKATQPK